MKGFHQQFSVLSALSKHHVITNEIIDKIRSEFVQQSKPLVRFLIEDKKIRR
jgi:type IV pilus assembly protein PilB